MAFQETAEAYIICPIEGTNTFAIHAKLIAIIAEDMQLA
jgi:histone H3/H4